MRWRELSVEVDPEAVESVSEVLRRWAPDGVAMQPTRLVALDEDGKLRTEGPVRVVAYLPEVDGVDDAVHAAQEALWHLHTIWPLGPVVIRTVDEADWANAWKQHFHAQRIGRRCVVKPPWEQYAAAPDDVVIEIDPGMAFGTGYHPTTRMCLRALEDLPLASADVLDVGTGSAILAIAAAKLGARRVVALDVDPVAVAVARENVARNGVEDRVLIGEGSLPMPESVAAQISSRQFPIVVANIIARVIVDLADELVASLTPEGTLIASGIIEDRVAEVQDRLERVGLTVEVRREGDWRTFVARRRRAI